METGTQLSILMVEDDLAVAEMYRLALTQAGHSVALATDGEMGIRLTAELCPQIVVLDLDLPGRDGLDVLASLKADSALAEIPVVMFSNACEQVRATALGLGAVDCVVKAETSPSLLARRLVDWARSSGVFTPH